MCAILKRAIQPAGILGKCLLSGYVRRLCMDAISTVRGGQQAQSITKHKCIILYPKMWADEMKTYKLMDYQRDTRHIIADWLHGFLSPRRPKPTPAVAGGGQW